MARKWLSPRCSQSGKPYTAPDGAPLKPGCVGDKKCPRCKRTFFINERHKWPTHGYYKTSFSYGE